MIAHSDEDGSRGARWPVSDIGPEKSQGPASREDPVQLTARFPSLMHCPAVPRLPRHFSNALRLRAQVRHDESDLREEHAEAPLDLRHDAPRPLSRLGLMLEAVVEDLRSPPQ